MRIQTVTEPLIRHEALQTDSAEEIQNWHDDVLIGTIVSHYTILEKLGCGIGVVNAAENIMLRIASKPRYQFYLL